MHREQAITRFLRSRWASTLITMPRKMTTLDAGASTVSIRTFRHSWMHFASIFLIVLLSGVACSTSSGQESNNPEPSPSAASDDARTPATPGLADRAPCEDGRLVIADLPAIDDQWASGLEESFERALTWREDSRLVEFRVSCGMFESGFRWQATYYSGEAQALFAADTRESSPIDANPEELPTLDLSALLFSSLREALLSIDYVDENELQPSSGVDVRVNSAALPFGPPDAPVGATFAHVSIEFRGEIKDLFIDIVTSEIYQFSSPSG